MMRTFFILILLVGLAIPSSDCGAQTAPQAYENILDIRLTPGVPRKQNGCFTDMGAWFGFTLPEKDKPVAGFCGPFSIYHRNWYARSLVVVEGAELVSSNYIPGEVAVSLRKDGVSIEEKLQFVDSRTSLLTIERKGSLPLVLLPDGIGKTAKLSLDGQSVVITGEAEEAIMVSFPQGVALQVSSSGYTATVPKGEGKLTLAVSLLEQETEKAVQKVHVASLMSDPDPALAANGQRWKGYLDKVIRQDMPYEYNRIATKSIVTLLSNWRAKRGAVYHDGIVPSHAVNYFIGCWAWDCWRFSAAMVSFFPELAKDNIRVMFDYQQPDGMVIDCIYPDASENNARDSKPPLAAWAVNEVFVHTKDTAFVREMYPKLLKYHKWWYEKRDHDGNHICEFGSVDGTLEAAAWESGMDNAIRFDGTIMLKNGADAYSTNQESVDLNSYLSLEYSLLRKFAALLGEAFELPDYSSEVAEYFFDERDGFFYDRRIDGSGRAFIREPGCEGYIPFWAKIATQKQFAKARKLLDDKKKFSTYIPFPTIAADNPKYDPKGYWRGPIWLDQTYYGITGYRNYGEGKKADKYTEQVFRNIQGLSADAPIYENYDTHTGAPMQASHFSWSAACLLMLYNDYAK